MRESPTRFGLVVAVALLGAAVAGPLFASPALGFGERVYDANTVVAPTDPFFLIWSGESVAQSFAASDTYILLNLTLRLKNDAGAGNLVNITIHPDAVGVPSSTFLAWANVQGGGTVGPVNVPLTPSPTLTRGGTYWIVATKSGPSNQGYEWHHSNANTYPYGRAMVNTGTGWMNPATATDLWFVTYGRQLDANVTAVMTVSTPMVLPKDTVVFTLHINNTGTLAAPTVWVNDTLPAGLNFLSDTAASVPAATGFPHYTFQDLANGPHSFTITVTVDVDVVPGTTLTNRATLTYTNSSGALVSKSDATASVIIGLQWKQLYLVPGNPGPPQSLVPMPPTGGTSSQVVYRIQRGGAAYDFQLDAPLSRTLTMVNVTAVLYLDSNSHGAKNLDMNFTLIDVSGASQTAVAYRQLRVTTDNIAGYQRFGFPFAMNLNLSFAAGHQVLLRIKNMATSQDDALLATNATATPSEMDLLTPTYVHVDGLSLRDAVGPATVWSPKDPLVVHANVSDPFGAAEIAEAWINLTDPFGVLVLNFTPMSLLGSGEPGWKLYGTTYGPLLANGTYQVEIVVQEGNGVLAYATATALVRAPALGLVVEPSQVSALSGDTFDFALWYNNTGTGPAGHVWLNVTLPNEVLFVTSSAETNRTGPTNWTWSNVSVGSHALVIQVTVRTGIPPTPSMTTTAALNFTDEKGHPWLALTASAGVVLQGPILSLAFSTSEARTHSNETFVLSAVLRNTGDLAGTVWLNMTWSSGLTYLSDTSALVGGTSASTGNDVDIRLANLGSGLAYTLNVTVRSDPGLPRGLNLTITAHLAYTNARGALMPNQTATQTVTVIAPEIVYATLHLNPSTVTPGDVVRATANFTNVGDEAALSLVVTLALSPALSVANASAPLTVSGSAALFVLADVGLGTHTIFINLTVSRDASDRAVLSVLGSIVYTDRLGNPIPPMTLSPSSVTVSAPLFQLGGSPSNATVEAGTAVTYHLNLADSGTGPATDVWLNASLPTELLYVSDSSDGQRTVAGTHVSWHWTAFGPGSRMFSFVLAARGTVANGTTANVTLGVSYADANGNRDPEINATLSASFIAPTIALSLETSATSVPVQTTFYYTLRARNVGLTTAKAVWLLDSVDPDLKIFSYTSNVAPTGAPDLNWTYADLQPGEEQAITLFVQVDAGVSAGAQIPNFLTAIYTNSQGQILGAVETKAVVVTVAASPSPLPYFLGAGIAVGAVVLFIVIRRREPRIEEIFLVMKNGILINHLTRNLSEERDPDVVGGMLTAVQQFVTDAFKFGNNRVLREMEFGDYRIFVEMGQNVFLAAVCSGSGTLGIERKLRKVLAEIEERYGAVLKDWNGDVDRILGAQDVMRARLLK